MIFWFDHCLWQPRMAIVRPYLTKAAKSNLFLNWATASPPPTQHDLYIHIRATEQKAAYALAQSVFRRIRRQHPRIH